MISWPSDLIDDIARRKSVLYIGAGVSANSVATNGSRPPIWKRFLETALSYVPSDKTYITDLLNKDNMLLACEIIMEKIGDNQFFQIAQDAFRRAGYSPALIHQAIYNLDSRIVISPNVDKIYDQYATSISHGTVVVKSYTDSDVASFLRLSDRLILKAHGSIDSPSEMIFSQYQYNKARYEYSGFYRLLDSLSLTHTYIFIGCGLNDPDIKLTLENYNFGVLGGRPHYFILPSDEINSDLERSLLKNCNLEVLIYDNTDRTYRNLLVSLEDLVQKVEIRRNEIGPNQSW